MPRSATAYSDLLADFERRGIDPSSMNFLNDPPFRAAENEDGTYLDNYVRHVSWRPYSEEYLDRARRAVTLLTSLMHSWLAADGRIAECRSAARAMSFILKMHGYWNFESHGALHLWSLESPRRSMGIFYQADLKDGEPADFSHSWIVAPPFKVADATLRLQEYPGDFAERVPETILAETGIERTARPSEIVSPEALQFFASEGLNQLQALGESRPGLTGEFLNDFPGITVRSVHFDIRYIPVGYHLPSFPFEELEMESATGETVQDFYRSTVLPAFSHEQLA